MHLQNFQLALSDDDRKSGVGQGTGTERKEADEEKQVCDEMAAVVLECVWEGVAVAQVEHSEAISNEKNCLPFLNFSKHVRIVTRVTKQKQSVPSQTECNNWSRT